MPYLLSDDGLQCKMPLLDEFENCSEVETYKSIISCVSCKENYYPINFVANTRICIANDEWSLEKDPLLDSITNC